MSIRYCHILYGDLVDGENLKERGYWHLQLSLYDKHGKSQIEKKIKERSDPSIPLYTNLFIEESK